MRVLITGVNGLLGFELALRLIDAGKDVVGLSRSDAMISSPEYRHIRADLNATDFVDRLPGDIDAIVHLAQSEKFRDFPASASEVFNVNTVSTLKLLEFSRAHGIKTFIYASSGGVYGNKDIGFTEESPVMGNGDLGFYLSTKLCSEILTDNFSVFFKVIQLRFFFMYGERQHSNMLIPRLVNCVRNQLPITLIGEQGITINPIYVSDAANAVIRALALPHSDKINVAGSENLSIRGIAEVISGKIGVKPVFNQVGGDAKNLIGDIEKMRRELCSPDISFEQGIEKLLRNGEKNK